jgi:hypothetical protein
MHTCTEYFKLLKLKDRAVAVTMFSIKATYHNVTPCSVKCGFGNNLGD